jgi:tRNA pseudouridine55 synthase
MNGIFIIDKPEGKSSHDVVQRIRAKFDTSKVGHLGTLDPMATGVLPVAIGKATRIGQYLPHSPKEYSGEMRFGFSTTTYDRNGTPTSEEQTLTAGPDEIEAALLKLTGELDQIAPSYSAKKFGGVPAYKLARRGVALEIAPARVRVESFKVTKFAPPFMSFHVVCSPGTYVRSLAHDLGQFLGCGAHLTALRRTRSGDFSEANAVALDRLQASDLIPLERLLESWPTIEVSGLEEDRVRHGNAIRSEVAANFARIFNKKGEFIAIASIENDLASPRLVLTSFTSD